MKKLQAIFILLVSFSCTLLAQDRCQLIHCCRGAQKDCLRVACLAGMPVSECCYVLNNRWFFGFAEGNCPKQ